MVLKFLENLSIHTLLIFSMLILVPETVIDYFFSIFSKIFSIFYPFAMVSFTRFLYTLSVTSF